jgi:hypothetical protein
MKQRSTEVSIQGVQFFVNGEPTYKGRTWNGYKIEGLLMNSRMVQGIFDDLNRKRAVYGHIPIRASGTPIATRPSSSPRCRSGESTG